MSAIWLCFGVFGLVVLLLISQMPSHKQPKTSNKKSSLTSTLLKEKKETTIHTTTNTFEIKRKLAMSDILWVQGSDRRCYSAEVYLVELCGTIERWVLKYSRSSIPQRNISEAVGGYLAYRISEKLNLNLVPKTKLIVYQNKLGTIQQYVNTPCMPSKQTYGDLLKQDYHEAIQRLKLFWFICGQWDISPSNVLFRTNTEPVAIDNDILLPQELCYYGQDPFLAIGQCDQDNQGSAEYPFYVRGSCSELDDFFQNLMQSKVSPRGLRLPEEWINTVNYFIKDKLLFAQTYQGDTYNYKLTQCKEEVLQHFDQLDEKLFDDVFEELKKLAETSSIAKIPSTKQAIEEVYQLGKRFFAKALYRRKLVARHFKLVKTADKQIFVTV